VAVLSLDVGSEIYDSRPFRDGLDSGDVGLHHLHSHRLLAAGASENRYPIDTVVSCVVRVQGEDTIIRKFSENGGWVEGMKT